MASFDRNRIKPSKFSRKPHENDKNAGQRGFQGKSASYRQVSSLNKYNSVLITSSNQRVELLEKTRELTSSEKVDKETSVRIIKIIESPVIVPKSISQATQTLLTIATAGASDNRRNSETLLSLLRRDYLGTISEANSTIYHELDHSYYNVHFARLSKEAKIAELKKIIFRKSLVKFILKYPIGIGGAVAVAGYVTFNKENTILFLKGIFDEKIVDRILAPIIRSNGLVLSVFGHLAPLIGGGPLYYLAHKVLYDSNVTLFITSNVTKAATYALGSEGKLLTSVLGNIASQGSLTVVRDMAKGILDLELSYKTTEELELEALTGVISSSMSLDAKLDEMRAYLKTHSLSELNDYPEPSGKRNNGSALESATDFIKNLFSSVSKIREMISANTVISALSPLTELIPYTITTFVRGTIFHSLCYMMLMQVSHVLPFGGVIAWGVDTFWRPTRVALHHMDTVLTAERSATLISDLMKRKLSVIITKYLLLGRFSVPLMVRKYIYEKIPLKYRNINLANVVPFMDKLKTALEWYYNRELLWSLTVDEVLDYMTSRSVLFGVSPLIEKQMTESFIRAPVEFMHTVAYRTLELADMKLDGKETVDLSYIYTDVTNTMSILTPGTILYKKNKEQKYQILSIGSDMKYELKDLESGIGLNSTKTVDLYSEPSFFTKYSVMDERGKLAKVDFSGDLIDYIKNKVRIAADDEKANDILKRIDKPSLFKVIESTRREELNILARRDSIKKAEQKLDNLHHNLASHIQEMKLLRANYLTPEGQMRSGRTVEDYIGSLMSKLTAKEDNELVSGVKEMLDDLTNDKADKCMSFVSKYVRRPELCEDIDSKLLQIAIGLQDRINEKLINVETQLDEEDAKVDSLKMKLTQLEELFNKKMRDLREKISSISAGDFNLASREAIDVDFTDLRSAGSELARDTSSYTSSSAGSEGTSVTHRGETATSSQTTVNKNVEKVQQRLQESKQSIANAYSQTTYKNLMNVAKNADLATSQAIKFSNVNALNMITKLFNLFGGDSGASSLPDLSMGDFADLSDLNDMIGEGLKDLADPSITVESVMKCLTGTYSFNWETGKTDPEEYSDCLRDGLFTTSGLESAITILKTTVGIMGGGAYSTTLIYVLTSCTMGIVKNVNIGAIEEWIKEEGLNWKPGAKMNPAPYFWKAVHEFGCVAVKGEGNCIGYHWNKYNIKSVIKSVTSAVPDPDERLKVINSINSGNFTDIASSLTSMSYKGSADLIFTILFGDEESSSLRREWNNFWTIYEQSDANILTDIITPYLTNLKMSDILSSCTSGLL
jgi:hypothetical protein